ncbi:CPBP family intramembrane glutamic endopeptidase [Hymenobacter sp. CRA2]|uniref:CPBP family intramembrane glutamic endopeptidase n=1 Tax=Hymenobacter sp. CRA2 TaxID=1955620 RepID=UPI00098EFBF5|nr:CPBP family intramembrane glutamic endopeptidase [Hymenobacter sp. CRA2]OON70324.1 hypothetical protein B0919_06235 [Hymenobacter sp. CRA2]
MEQLYPESEAPLAEAPAPVAPTVVTRYYPTYKESWGMLGWLLLSSILFALPIIAGHAWLPARYATGFMVVLGQVAQLALILFLRRRAGPKRLEPTSWTGPADSPRLFAVVAVVAVALLFARLPVAWLDLPTWSADKTFVKLMQQPALALVVMCVGAPVLEEWLMRGLLLPGLTRNYGAGRAILQTSLLFGIIHLNPPQALSAFLLGLFLGWLYTRTQSLMACIAVHAINNMAAWGAMYAAHGEYKWHEHISAAQPWEFATVAVSLLVVGLSMRYIQQLTRPVAASSELPTVPAL